MDHEVGVSLPLNHCRPQLTTSAAQLTKESHPQITQKSVQSVDGLVVFAG
jgi:hypothetical protein